MGIGPHIDNDSVLTAVFLLSDPNEFTGGSLTFRGEEQDRKAQLRLGDCAVFRGESLLHWVTPVLSGRRMVLQIELAKIHEDDGVSSSDDPSEVEYDDDDDDDGFDGFDSPRRTEDDNTEL